MAENSRHRCGVKKLRYNHPMCEYPLQLVELFVSPLSETTLSFADCFRGRIIQTAGFVYVSGR